ncbi:Iporin, partial [Chelonia mydas]
ALSRMDSPPKLAGETLIVHHIPLVHCQVPDRQCCSGSKRTNPFCQPDLGITRTASLPERDLLQADSLVYSSLLQASDAPAEAAEDKESKARDSVIPGITTRHNPFLLGDSEGHGLLSDSTGQKSFRLHSSMVAGKPAFQLHELPPFHLHDAGHVVKPWSMASRSGVVDGQEDKRTSADVQKRNNADYCLLASERMELDECSCQRGSFSFEGGDQDWNNGSDESGRNLAAPHSRTCSCSSTELLPCRCYSTSSQSETGDQQMGYISDSSCNSSDGVLVNFSALYNKMNGHSRSNLNSANLSCDSSFCSHSDAGAFYLDLHSSPTESKMSCESHNPESSGKVCGCHHPSSPVLDANCNSYHLHCEPCTSESSDLTACFQSQARLVVATQNYYKLVTCDLSSQSSPSPAGSSITSCSEDHTKGSPVQPSEYYLFRRPDAKPEESDGECFMAETKGEAVKNMIEGQVYVNISPPNLNAGRPRSRSYDRNLDRSPTSRLGSLERMMSCPVKLSESPALTIQSLPPKRVTSFAELAKGRKKNGSSPPLRTSGDSSLEFSPIPEFQRDCPGLLEDRARRCQSLPPMPFGHCLNRSCEGSRVEHRLGDGPRACSSKDSGANGPEAGASPWVYGALAAACWAALRMICPQAVLLLEGPQKQMEDGGTWGTRSHSLVCGGPAGQPVKQLQLGYADFFPEYFSLAEKPPAEFCLSPDGNTESISIDLLQKKGLVKAINTAVDLIVAHFGSSRDPGVKAKLGNSSVSPNVGHLILKYLCPAIRDILSDGLKAYVLDVIIGQRKNTPWSVVEASTQLGPSTKVLHGLHSRISQFAELTSHSMRFNAFIFGLLNVRSLEFWFNHLYNHEDIILVHYQPVGFLCLSHGVCQALFEELLLLLQPLSLLPFSLDLLFEHHLLQMGREQQQRKELLRVKQDLLLSVHSTLQPMRSRGSTEEPAGWSTAPEQAPGSAGDERPSAGQGQEGAAWERVKGVGASCGDGAREEEQRKAKESAWEGKKDKQAGWWYQLMQSSQVYIEGSAEGSKQEVVTPPVAESSPGPPDGSQPTKWGHLFGARKMQKEARQPNRLPSGWLTLDRSVFQLMAQTVGAGMWREAAPGPERPQAELPNEPPEQERAGGLPPQIPCEVKALCHHIATEAGQLSFTKGAVLRVLAKVDSDWLQCGLGSQSGLVPIMYVTHPADEDY